MKIVVIRASLNKGLTKGLKTAFPRIVPVQKPNFDNIIIQDPC